MEPDERVPADTEALMAQGRELLEQSRDLLRNLDERLERGGRVGRSGIDGATGVEI